MGCSGTQEICGWSSRFVSGNGDGGQVETVLISPYSIAGHKQTSGDPQAYNKGYDEGNILRTVAQGLGLPTTNLGWADTAIAMSEFFQ